MATTDEYIKALHQFTMLSGLGEDRLRSVLDKCQPYVHPLKKKFGSPFIRQGERPQYVYFLMHGAVFVYRRLPDERKGARKGEFRAIPLDFLREPVALGEIEPLIPSDYVASVSRVTEVEMLEMPVKDFLDLIPEISWNLTKSICEKVAHAVTYSEEQILTTKKKAMFNVIELYAATMQLEEDAHGFVFIGSLLKPSRVGKFADCGKRHRENFFDALARGEALSYVDDPNESNGKTEPSYRINLRAAKELIEHEDQDGE